MGRGERHRGFWSVRLQIVLAVNLAVGGALAGLLVVDYRHSLASRLEQKRAALRKEAETLLPAIEALGDQGFGAIQKYVDRVWEKMQAISSPRHHIALRRRGGRIIQPAGSDHASRAMVRAMERASARDNWRAKVGSREIIVGKAKHQGITVFVSEYATDVHHAVRREVAWRIAALAGVALLGAIVVNVVLLRVITWPLGELLATVRRIGAGEVGVEARRFRTRELDLLAQEITAMSRSLEAADRERRQELGKARKLQEHLWAEAAKPDGLAVDAMHRPATDVAGDYHDILRLDGDRCLLCVADVTGHGVPAAMGAGTLKALLHSATEETTEPAALIARINRLFGSVILPEDFASMILLRFNPHAGLLEYASAGHETCYLLRADGALQRLESTGMVLGVWSDTSWDRGAFGLRTGDRLFLYTDGVTEARSAEGEQFGRGRTESLVAGMRDVAFDEILTRWESALHEHMGHSSPGDDVTAVVAEVTSVPIADRPRKEQRVVEESVS